jgi:hypothetical protein
LSNKIGHAKILPEAVLFGIQTAGSEKVGKQKKPLLEVQQRLKKARKV